MNRLHALALVVGLSASASAQTGPLARANWLAGCWELRAPNRVTLEMWMPASGDMMLGASRTTTTTATSAYEQLRLKADGDLLVYTAVPSGQKETSFPSTTVSDSLLVFENTAHDFPQRITYRRRGADSVIATIEGPGPNGTTRRAQFPFRRASCLTATPPPPPDTVLVGADVSRDRGMLLVARGAAPNIDVYLYDASGAVVRRLTDHSNFDYQPRWSPDGQRLAYVSVRENRQAIFTMRPDGSDSVQLTGPGVQNSEPAWSPDGRRIAFRSDRDGNSNIYVMNSDGSDQRALTTDARPESGPAWSPDGKQILFSMTSGRAEVFIMNADGSEPRQLTQSGTGSSRTAFWSPDGKQIAFSTNRDGNEEVYVMAADGSGARNVSSHAAADIPVGWTADGQVLFLSTRDRAGRDLYRLKIDGSAVTRVTRTP